MTPDLHQASGQPKRLLQSAVLSSTKTFSWTTDYACCTDRLTKMILDVTVADEHGEEAVPTEFRLGVTNRVVCEIIDRWLAKDYSYFKLRADDKAIYILRHDKLIEQWELILFNQQDV